MKMEIKLLLHSLVFFFLLLTNANSEFQTQPHEQEHAVLMKVKQYLENPSFLSHWTQSNTSHCSWPEITCTNESVTGLTLFNASTQTIPPFICDLKNLTHLDFSNNSIPGEFPTFIYKCSKLLYLDLSVNSFVGNIPKDIDQLSNLQYLSLGYNNFSGDIPSSIGNLKDLTVLSLPSCLFNGTFPDEIGNLSNLETLDLSSNSLFLPSRLSTEWTKFKSLKVFYMYDSNLVGEIPETVGTMVALEKLDLSQNDLTGKIPSGLFLLKNLSILFLSRNNLSGEIPDVVEALNLTIIDFSRNRLSGKIPSGFGKLQKLTGLGLSLNNLSGEIPQSLGRLPSLVDFRVFMNNLSGTLPPDFGLYSENLSTFWVSTNNFSGRLPENLCYHGHLYSLALYENNLSGEFPQSLGNCSNLTEMKIYSNEFSGNFPSGLWTLNISTFMVSHNKFTGELPQRLSSTISRLEISHNQFYGTIPSGISSWTNVVVFEASNNYLNGSIPKEITTLPKLTTLLLDQNHLTGPLPLDIISWESLVTLNLSQNQLSGEIPDSIRLLPVLSQLDLSQNQFSGQIPSLSRRITNLNLSSNHLTGRVPSEFEISVYSTSFLDNSGLCANTPSLNLRLCNSSPQKSSKGSSWSVALIISLAIVACLLALFVSLITIKFYRRRKKGLDNSWKLISFQRLTFTESNIVSSLTEHNIIGSGGYGTVYRVAVDDIGFVAVKKIRENKRLDQNLESSFHAEVRILSNIRHKNIVKLMCCISNEDTMLLVYEYVENRSLDRWLHRKIKSSSTVSGSVHHVVLDWPKRLKIAIGAAQGLCYMHHDCSPPIVHRDIKTSNILLDSQFNAKVADFGLARMLIKPGELATMSSVIGSFGYMAPEYVQTTRVSEKIDVFSFGVILLELTTGKEANYGDEHSSLYEWAWRHHQLGSNIEELLDSEVIEASYLDGMCKVFKLGVMCTSTHATSRPSMKEVLQVLMSCEESFSYGERNVGHFDEVPLLRNSKKEHKLDIDNDS